MSGVNLKVKINDSDANASIAKLLSKADNPRPVLLEIGEYLTESTEQRFVDQVDPAGNPWKSLSPKTKKRKKKNSDLILVLNAYLGSTIRYQAGNDYVRVGTDRIYGATHQFGDDSRGIPQREFLGISDADETEIIAILTDYLSL